MQKKSKLDIFHIFVYIHSILCWCFFVIFAAKIAKIGCTSAKHQTRLMLLRSVCTIFAAKSRTPVERSCG